MDSEFVEVKNAKENNLKGVNVSIPRNQIVLFTGVSGSGKSSLAFGTIYAEAQRRFLESVSPYARRLFNQMKVPKVDTIEGLPPAIALQQNKGGSSGRSSVGSVSSLSHLIRMLYSRVGDYPSGMDILYAESFSSNTPEGACPRCHGIGKIFDVTEDSLVPDKNLSIRERAVAAWPPAWHGQNLKDMLVTLGYDIDLPWKKLPKKHRDWILFTEEQPSVPVYAGFEADEVKRALKKKMEPSYHGNFSSARRYILDTFAKTQSPLMKKRVSKYLVSLRCPVCLGKKLKRESLRVKFKGLDIAEFQALTLKDLRALLKNLPRETDPVSRKARDLIVSDLSARLEVLDDLGLGHLTLERETPTLSPGELQRLRLGAQVHSKLFGVIFILDEPSAGLHPKDTEALITVFKKLRDAGNSLFIVEHEVEIIKEAEWVVDVGPRAGKNGGEIVYSGPYDEFKTMSESLTMKFTSEDQKLDLPEWTPPRGWIEVKEVSARNIQDAHFKIPLGMITAVSGVSGSGKTTLITNVFSELMQQISSKESSTESNLEHEEELNYTGKLGGDYSGVKRVIHVDQKPIGRTPRSNLATYTGVFDHIRKLFASTKDAKKYKYDAGRFSFNVKKGRCSQCEGEGFVMVELLFLPSVYSPCPLCGGTRYNKETLRVSYKNLNIAQVLDLTVDEALEFFPEEGPIHQGLKTLRQVGLSYLKLGQSATELSGGEAQRIKLAKELQSPEKGKNLYILDEPTTGLHPSDVELFYDQIRILTAFGNTVILIEHDMGLIARADWVIDMGPGAGDNGGKVIFEGHPEDLAKEKSPTGKYLAPILQKAKMNPPSGKKHR